LEVPTPTRPQKKNLPTLASKKELTPLQKLTPIQKRLLIWMAKGKPAVQFANENAAAIVPKHSGDEKKLRSKARGRVRKWSHTEHFRQALWDWSVSELDLTSMDILQGIAAKAAAGRVDAARLALEITGRHAPNSDIQPAAIQIVMNQVPRPQPVAFIDADAEEVVDVEDEAV
jgi:hypothetical protein